MMKFAVLILVLACVTQTFAGKYYNNYTNYIRSDAINKIDFKEKSLLIIWEGTKPFF